ncbi:MAG: Neutral/alkaline non-lysosomal ceramidase [Candidatus Hydrogenedentes bacterium ADurb.Bin101]|jgi:hypothetical protein|nr:MAG: Neutral/alkaline non-lysosomal ceramidase [Candidatus Hydrogenedentes bacterium ADurb.Bin101]HOC68607.1 hypothetical protein [Candidatus Hydrogenedentota bacterium]
MNDSFIRRHKILTAFCILILLAILLPAAFLFYRMIGPHRGYTVDFVKVGEGAQPGVLEVGVSKWDITPDLSLYDTYNDTNNDNTYDPVPGEQTFLMKLATRLGLINPGEDTYNDRNGNGRFDPVWIAGFGSNRPAKGVHDPLWARAMAFRNNGVTVAMVTLDAIGLFHEKIIDIRKMIDPGLNVDHVIVSCLHNHETPDTMGNWSGVVPTPSNFDHRHMDFVKLACKNAVEEAVRNLSPADMYISQKEINPEGLVNDSRKPIVIDTKLCCARFTKAGTDETIATMVSWGNHPETLDGDNPYLTSDFCGYWRDGIEKGVSEPNGAPGMGGMCLYFQGMVGGLMTQLHTTVSHRNGVDKYKEASFEKAQALGENLAVLTVNTLRGTDVFRCESPRVGVAAKTIYAPLAGLFKYAISLGLVHPGVFWREGGIAARSEVDVVRVGDLEIATVPGELYPEIADGGVEAKPGRDFDIQAVEVPPLRKEMHGKVNMIFGLANDEIGYILPKSQWDAEPPYIYDNESQYGEENSGGPEVAPVIHREVLALLRRLEEAWPQ